MEPAADPAARSCAFGRVAGVWCIAIVLNHVFLVAVLVNVSVFFIS